jgi:hypothetical protein
MVPTVRIRLGPTVLAVSLLFGNGATFALPQVASAVWREESWPCNVAPWAVLPQPLTWFQVGEPAIPPMGYFTYGEPGMEAPTESNFTAVADWGDGTTSPASISGLSVGDCHGVSAPGHPYSSTGTYPFSYTVHDTETGLDHTLAATQLHIWSLVPRLLGDASLRTIRPTVGALWNGVVGQFAYEGTVNPSYPYSAQIEWGDGQSTPGTIVLQGSNTFDVSGSLTYTRSFNGTVTVLLWHSTQLLGKWTTSRGRSGRRANKRTPTHSPAVSWPANTRCDPARCRGCSIRARLPHQSVSATHELRACGGADRSPRSDQSDRQPGRPPGIQLLHSASKREGQKQDKARSTLLVHALHRYRLGYAPQRQCLASQVREHQSDAHRRKQTARLRITTVVRPRRLAMPRTIVLHCDAQWPLRIQPLQLGQ